MNTKDIKKVFRIDIEPIRNNTNELLKTFQGILSKFVVYKKSIYCGIKIPYTYESKKHNRIPQIEKFHINVFNRFKLGAGLEDNPFLKERVKESYIITQRIIKSNNRYIILTIEKHIMLKNFSIILYMPFNGKKFLSTVYFSDIGNLSDEFLSRLFMIDKKAYNEINK